MVHVVTKPTRQGATVRQPIENPGTRFARAEIGVQATGRAEVALHRVVTQRTQISGFGGTMVTAGRATIRIGTVGLVAGAVQTAAKPLVAMNTLGSAHSASVAQCPVA